MESCYVGVKNVELVSLIGTVAQGSSRLQLVTVRKKEIENEIRIAVYC